MPKTYNNLWQKIITWENLYTGYTNARKNKRFRPEVLEFSAAREENLINIQNHLIWQSWSPGRFREFMVYEPKARFIQAPSFKDRVVHHALVQVIEPLFERKFIYDSYACRTDKGTTTAVLRTQKFLRTAKVNWSQVYVLKADISKYFYSIGHDHLLRILKKTIRDKKVLWLCENIISKCGSAGQGIPVGALTSQLFANVYLDQLDHFIKDDLGVKFYTRYMDDWIILESNKKRLWKILDSATDFLTSELGLRLNPKTSIFPAARGVDFCGYRIWATHLLPRKRNVKRARKRFNKFSKLYARNQIVLEEIRASVMSFLGYMKHCNGYQTTSHILNNFVLRKE